MLKVGRIYKHVNNSDVALEIVSVLGPVGDSISYGVTWWNIGLCHAPWPMNMPDTVKIAPDAEADWTYIRRAMDD